MSHPSLSGFSPCVSRALRLALLFPPRLIPIDAFQLLWGWWIQESGVCVRVCVRHPLQETVLAKFCTSGKMTLSEKGGNPGLTLFLRKACRVFEMLCCYCQRWVQLLLCCFEKCIPLIPMINCRNRYLWWLGLGFCHPFSSKIIF